MEHIEELKKKFSELLDLLKDELSGIRTNRPTPKLIEDINVEYMEQMLSIKQVGSISVELPRNLIITPWDKNLVSSIVKAVETAGLGLTASAQGDIVRVNLPELTEERRDELGRVIKKIAEETRIKMRISRDEVNKIINEENDKDEKFKQKNKLQDIVDDFNKSVDKMVEAKLGEIMN